MAPLALTWPHGLEDLLKAKARLWSRVANAVVGVMLAAVVVMFPAAWWKIALVGGGWLVFSSALALKSVSLVTVPSSSGEPEPPNRARQWIAMLGTLAFGAGVVTGSWHVAIMGIVFSSLVAVAMWQNLRARLPYLFDRWSEQPVPAPSLLHATVGIALLVECVAVFTGIAGALGGASSLWLARALGYGIAGLFGCVLMQSFLSGRGVDVNDILTWAGERRRIALREGLVVGACAGVGLAVLASFYLMALHWVPAARESLEEAAKFASSHALARPWIFVMAVFFAPVAGWVSDRYRKSQVVLWSSVAQVVLLLLCAGAFALEWFWTATALFFLLALQAAVLQPAKGGIVKEYVGERYIGMASGWVQMSAILAFVSGQWVGGKIFEHFYETGQPPDAGMAACWTVLVMALFSLLIPADLVHR